MNLAEVLTDGFGVSGRAILRALIDGTQTPEQIAQHACGLARRKIGLLTGALAGQFTPSQRFMLAVQLNRVERTEQHMLSIGAELDRVIATRALSQKEREKQV